MWKHWKKEILGILFASLFGVCLITGITIHLQKRAQENQHFNTHVMINETLYWLDTTLPELPEGYEEFTRVESSISNQKHLKTDKPTAFQWVHLCIGVKYRTGVFTFLPKMADGIVFW